MVLLSVVLYGLYIFFIKVLNTHVNMSVILFAATAIMLIPIGANVLFSGARVAVDRYLIYVLLAGVIGGIGLIFYYNALAKGHISIVMPLFGVGMVIIPTVLGFIFLKEPPTVTKLAGITLAITAILLLTR